MSRPPIHRAAPSPRGPDRNETRYFGPGFADLVALAETLARDRHGIEIPPKGRGLARTLMELPALLAHILGEHQSLYAREACLGTAELPENLVRHARKLSHEPDAGVAATGLAAFTVKPGLAGQLGKGFALQSAPLGEARAQTYETLAEVQVDAAWNVMIPQEAAIFNPVQAAAGGAMTLILATPHTLERGAIVVLAGRGRAGAFTVTDPMEGADSPSIGLQHLGGHDFTDAGTEPDAETGYWLLARPATEARLFGWNAPAGPFPPARLASRSAYVAPASTAAAGTVAHGYADLSVAPSNALFLSAALPPPVTGDRVVVTGPAATEVLGLEAVGEAVVTFRRGEQVSVPVPVAPTTAGGPITVSMGTRVMETETSARVTTLSLVTLPAPGAPGGPRTWTTFPLTARVLTGWTTALGVAPLLPNPALLTADLTLAADLAAMRPGRTLILRRISTGEAREASIAALRPPTPPDTRWGMTLAVNGGVPGGWPLHDVEILGNIARVSHGEAKSEIVGGSDGISPHQKLALKSAPVTRLPGALGAEIALEVRVDGVLWDLAADFHGLGPDARALTQETDAEGKVTLRFGGEGRGAIPPAGRRSITADYRQGLGTIGNAGAGRLSRIRRASPLLDQVTNPLAISGGTDPAGTADIARQATRPVRVFDRAVSVQDHADLALLFPGVARTAARWTGAGAVELVAADATGAAVADASALLAFLDARRDTGLPLILVPPQAVDVSLALRVERDRRHLAEAVRLTVQDSLIGAGPPPGLFTFAGRALSMPQSLSGLYARVLALDGVTGVEATQFRIGSVRGVADILHATDRQWLSLPPAALTITIVEPGLLTRDAS